MRVAVVSATYVQGLSYQENVWAEELALMGHQVRVFRADDVGGAVTRERVGDATYEVEAVRVLRLPRNILPSAKLGPALVGFAPELVLWFGVPMYFGRALFSDRRLRGLKVAAFFSLNNAMHRFDWRASGLGSRDRALAWAFRLLRAPDVVAACLRAEVVVANTPETRDILLLFPRGKAREEMASRIQQLPLGFSPRHFLFDPQRRQATRKALGFADDELVVVVSSRFAENKVRAIGLCVDAVCAAMERAPRVRGLLVGLSDGPVSDRFRARIDSAMHPDRFVLRPFADRAELSRMFHAADVALFAQPSISCQEALGTGAFTVFADDGSTDHLVDDASQGSFFRTGDPAHLLEVLLAALKSVGTEGEGPSARQARAGLARRLGYDRIARTLLQCMDLDE